jgi:aspartate kinase
MKVIKFGGTSQSLIGYSQLLNIISQTLKYKDKLIIVLSAVSGVTTLLEKFTQTNDFTYIEEAILKNKCFINELNKNYDCLINLDEIFNKLYTLCNTYIHESNNSNHLKATIIGYGEVMSTNIFYNFVSLVKNNDTIKLLNSYDFIESKTESSKLYPSTEFICSKSIFNIMNDNQIFITQGFIASTPSKLPILLGRGGSDTTGALIANTVDAFEYEVWTDVDGIYSADPRIIEKPILIKEINYDVIQEMAGMGAKVMHPFSILPCQQKNIPIVIKNTFNILSDLCTYIKNSNENVFSVASQKNVTLFKITSLSMWNSYGFVYDIFKIFSDKKVNVNIITTSQFTISTTTDEKDLSILNDLYEDLKESYEVEMITKRSIISIVSNKLNDIINKIDITEFEKDIIHFSSNNLTISFVINEDNTEKIIKLLHNKCSN